MADEIGQILGDYNAADLASMAAEAGIVGETGRRLKRDALVDALRRRFFTPERIAAAYAKLSHLEKEVLNRILLRPESTPTTRLRAELVRAGLVTEAPQPERSATGSYRSPRPYVGSVSDRKSTVFEDVIARLTLYGLVFSQDAGGLSPGYQYKLRLDPGKVIYVPQAVRRHLPEPTPIPVESQQYKPEQISVGDINPLLRDLYIYWDYARRSGINLLNSGAVGKRELRVLNDMMLVPDPGINAARTEQEMPYLYFLRELLEDLSLLRPAGGRLRPVADDPLRIPDFWTWPSQRQMLACLTEWHTSTRSPESELVGADGSPNQPEARQQLLAVLLAAGQGDWLSLEEVMQHLWEVTPDFLYPSLHRLIDGNRWYGGSFQNTYYYGDKQKYLDAVNQAERAFVRACLDESLFRLGVLSRGVHTTPNGDKENLYSLSPQGYRAVAALLGKEKPRQEVAPDHQTDTGRILVQPNFHIVAIGPVPVARLAQLDLFAQRLQAGVGAFEYELTKESVYQAQQMGLEVGQVRGLLAEMCDGALPQNVERTLQEWAQHHERIVFRTDVDLLQSIDPALLEKLLATKGVAAQIESTLTPTLALVKSGAADVLTAALRAEALLPMLSQTKPTAADNSIRLDAEGHITLSHPFPHFLLEGRLAKLAERNAKGEWRLTEASIQRAGKGRAKVTAVLADLAALSLSPLPDALVQRIRAWGGYYGSAGLARITVVEFQSRDVLDELLALPELKDKLRALDGKLPLAVVNEKESGQVKKRLAALGVLVKDGIPRLEAR